MPSAGGVCPPVIIPLNYNGKTCDVSTDTYIELQTETPDCKIYFTTDGSKPLPYQINYVEGKSTFVYKGPFNLKQGKRLLKALAVTRDGLKESDVVTKTFNVQSIDDDVDHNDLAKVKQNTTKDKKHPTSSSSSSCETLIIHEDDPSLMNIQHQQRSFNNTSSGLYFPNNGASSTFNNPFHQPNHHSGTQINLWGFPPFQAPNWSVGGISNSIYSTPHLGYMTTRALENLDQSKIPFNDLRQAIREEGDRLLLKNSQLQIYLANQMKRNEVNDTQNIPPKHVHVNDNQDDLLKEISPGNGYWQGQLKHILGHLKDKIKNDGRLQKKLSYYKLGKITRVTIQDDDDDDDDSFEIKVTFLKVKGPPSNQEKQPQHETYLDQIPYKRPKVKLERQKSQDVVTKAVIKKYKDVKSKTDSNFVKFITKSKHDESTKTETKRDPFHETEEYQAEGTLKDWKYFKPEDDCERLRKAMKGLGTDEAAIIDILGYRSNKQRIEIVKQFKTMFGKDLSKELESELSGHFLICCQYLCMTPQDFDANQLRKAMKGLGTDEDVLIEILCSRTNKQIRSIVQAYNQLFQRDLEKDLIGDTSGNFRKVLVSQVQGNRGEDMTFDLNKVRDDVNELIKAGSDKWGTDESVFNKILCQRSFPHLRSIMREYKKLTKNKSSLQDDIRAEFSGNVRNALLAIVNMVEDKPRYFAKKMYDAMKGLGTDDDTLVRIVVSRCECDMIQIKRAFQKSYGKNLSEWIKDDISGDYLEIILALIGEKPSKQTRGKSSSNAANNNYNNNVNSKNGNDDDDDADEEEVEEQEEEEINTRKDPTLLPHSNFNAQKDCEILRKAMKGLGTDEESIIKVLTARSLDQRMEIVNMFKTMFGKDLIKELKSELSGNFCHVMTSLCKSRSQFAADELRTAVKGLGTDEDCLIDMICTRSNKELKDISQEFQKRHGKNLEDCIATETSGHLRRLFVSLLQCNRPITTKISKGLAEKDAKLLMEAGELRRFGSDESRFNAVLCSRSHAQLRATFREYSKLSGKDIVDVIKSETSGDLQKGFVAIVEVIRDDVGFYTRLLYDSMHGLGTNDDKLIRVIVSRSEVDMTQIKDRFEVNYKQSLTKYIKGDTSGDYRKSLLSLIGER